MVFFLSFAIVMLPVFWRLVDQSTDCQHFHHWLQNFHRSMDALILISNVSARIQKQTKNINE